MAVRSQWIGIGLLLLVTTIGCSDEPAASEPDLTAPPAATETHLLAIPQPSAGEAVSVGPLAWTLPGGWTRETPTSSMRQAQYGVPGSAGEAECVVFYFGAGQGGDSMANARRWAGQFSQTDGSDSVTKMSIEQIDGGAFPLILVSVTGTYDGGMTMTAAPATPKPDSMLLGGIAQGPDAPWFFKLTGPEATVRENREALVALLRSIHQEI